MAVQDVEDQVARPEQPVAARWAVLIVLEGEVAEGIDTASRGLERHRVHVRHELAAREPDGGRDLSQPVAERQRGERAVAGVDDVAEPQIGRHDRPREAASQAPEREGQIAGLTVGGGVHGEKLAYLRRTEGALVQVAKDALVADGLEAHTPPAEDGRHDVQQAGRLDRDRGQVKLPALLAARPSHDRPCAAGDGLEPVLFQLG